MSKTFNDSKHFTYALSRDVNATNAKTYKGFDTIPEMEAYINKLNKSNFYEQLNQSMRRLYCDLDFDSIETPTKYKYMLKDEFDIMIRSVISNISILLDHLIEFDDVIIAISEKPICANSSKRKSKNNPATEYISSCHLIFKNIKMEALQQKDLITELNKKFGSKIDTKVYGHYQQFKLIYNSKYGKNSYLKLYNNSNCKFEDYLVSNIIDSATFEIPFEKRKAKICDEMKETICDEMKETICDEMKDTICDEMKETILCDDIILLMDSIIEDLDLQFWNNSTDWLGVTSVLIKHKIIYDMDKWCAVSAFKSLDASTNKQRYTTDDNLKKVKQWTDTNRSQNTYISIPYIIKVFNKYLPYRLITSHKFDIQNLISFITKYDTTKILNIRNVTQEFVIQHNIYEQSILDDIPTKPDIKYRSPRIIFDRVGGWVDIVGLPLTNYYLDGYLIDNHKTLYKNKIEYTNEYINIQDSKIYNSIDDYLTNSDDKFFTLGSFMGSGKTHYIIKYFLKKMYELDPESENGIIGGITPSNTLNLEMVKKLTATDTFNFISHTTKSKNGNYSNSEIREIFDRGESIPTDDESINLFTSLESINKLELLGESSTIRFLILDEITTVINHFKCDSTTNLTPKEKYKTFLSFCNVLKSASKIGLFDAYLCPNQLDLINKITSMNHNSTCTRTNNIINVTQNNFRSFKHNIYKCKKTIDEAINDRITKNKRIAICSNTKTQINKYYCMLSQSDILVNKRILKITSDGLQIIKICLNEENEISNTIILDVSKNKRIELQKYYSNLEELINNHSVDVFLFSPTITTGTSIDGKIFNTMFCFYSKYSMTARECIQQMYRIRHLTDKEINIYIAEPPKFPTPERDISIYKTHIEKPRLEREKHFTDYEGDNIFIQNDLYTEMMAINTKESYESENYFYQTFYKLLKIEHNININFIRSKKDLEMSKDYAEEEATRLFNIWNDTPIISIYQFDTITDLKSEIKSNKSDLELTDNQAMQFTKFNKIFKITATDAESGSINFISNGIIHYNDVFVPANQRDLLKNPKPLYTKFRSSILDNRHFYNHNILKSSKFQYIQSYLYYDKSKTIQKYKDDSKKYPQDPYNSTHTNHIEYELISQILILLTITPDKRTIINYKQIKNALDNDPLLSTNILNYINLDLLDNPISIKKGSSKFYSQMIRTMKKILEKINLFVKIDSKTKGKIEDNRYIIEQSGYENYKFTNEKRINTPYKRFSDIDNETNITTFYNREGTNKQKMIQNKNMTFKRFKSSETKQTKAPYYFESGSKKLNLVVNDDINYYVYESNNQSYNYEGDILQKRNRPYTTPLKIHLFKIETINEIYFKEYIPDFNKSNKIRRSMNNKQDELYKKITPYNKLIENKESDKIIDVNINFMDAINDGSFFTDLLENVYKCVEINRCCNEILPEIQAGALIKSKDIYKEYIKRYPMQPLRDYAIC